ncbi:MAG: division/cell wall cluster transcriptional repressor MraZ [Lachnospiraceae bacterium]|nr:division/cell wall cluster transcriptional repressor MraZ [Lachnospiraceae bacterium]
MFMGEYNHTVDTKGRLIIPSKFREVLGDKFVITKGMDGCLFVYDYAEWSNFEEKLKALPINKKDNRMLVRHFLAGAAEVEVDKQGRILIPVKLREYAEITKDVTLIGAAGHIEIWSDERWTALEEDEESMEDIAERMADMGFGM